MPPGSADPATVHAVLTAASTTTTTTSPPIFLIPNGTFVVELILFIVVLGIVAKFILPPMQKAMDERSSTIRSALQAGDQGQAEAEHLAVERREVLESARAEARSLLDTAGARSAELFEQGRSRGRGEHDRILAEAQPRIDEERRAVERELTGRMGELVVAAAGSVVGEPVDVAKHRQVIDEAVARVLSGDESGALN
ncbi:MAG: synthase subunit [Acidimicrobiaceae bacterium]|jgi:F-type H+-transporting ATPase subunit b|nr:synthase subunit [Acidimicrobiaceae bacterium]